MVIVVASFLSLYCMLLALLIVAWNKATIPLQARKVPDILISVIIPVRNEEKNIGALMASLGNQQYSYFEIIVVDDHSSDNTRQVVQQAGFHNLFFLESFGVGKKEAIVAGIAMAKGSVIVTTDADCLVLPDWLAVINNTFSNERVVMAFGGVAIIAEDLFSGMQSIEMASLIGTSASTASLGYPTMCNGANLAFRKNAFEKVNGYEGNIHIPSGDDEFLMRKIQAAFPGGVTFLPGPGSVVCTLPQPTLKDFLNQRLRWAGKWKYNTSLATVSLAFFVLSVQLSVLSCWILMWGSTVLPLLLLVKIGLEGFWLIRICTFLGIRWRWNAFLILQFAYPLYVVWVGVLSNFIRYTWKGRKLS